MEVKTELLDEKGLCRCIARIAYEIIEKNKGVDNLCIVGILSRGAEIAARIAAKIADVEGKSVDVGLLDITLFREDRTTAPDYADRSELPFDIAGKKVILVDDVIFTGRSVRAAIDAIMDRGRPQNIQLAVLIDRGHRELPLRADYVGKNVPTAANEQVRVMVKERDGVDKVVIC